MNPGDNSLQVRIREKEFRGEQESHRLVIKDLNLSIKAGSFVTLLAPSGAGKSTLLRIIAGLDSDYNGDVIVDGFQKRAAGRDVQLVFQDYGLLPWKTVRQNIAFAQSADRDSTETIDSLIRTIGLSGLERRWPPNLSGGQKGLVAIARALVDKPKFLLLDEPFKNLDLFTKLQIQTYLLRALQDLSTTVVMASHSVEDAAFLSDRVLLLSRAPMQFHSEFPVENPRPRDRGDADLARKSAEIVSACLRAFPCSTSGVSSVPLYEQRVYRRS